MTATPVVSAEIVAGSPDRIGVTVTAPDADSVSITRITSAGRELLLGGQDVLIAGSTYVVDHTAPINTPAQYVAVGAADGVLSGESAPSNPVTIESATTGMWVSDPTVPGSDLELRVAEWRDVLLASASQAVVPLGGSLAIGLTAPREAPSWLVTLRARGTEERAAILQLLNTAPVLLLRPGSVFDEPARYVVVGSVSEQRIAPTHWNYELRVTAAWPPSRVAGYGAEGGTYADLAAYYTSYDDPALTSRTYLDLAKAPQP